MLSPYRVIDLSGLSFRSVKPDATEANKESIATFTVELEVGRLEFSP